MVIATHNYADGGEVTRKKFRKGPPKGRKSKKKKGVVDRTVDTMSGSLRERQMKELGL